LTASGESQPMVSVIMPVHNDEKYVGEAIDSILNQTFNELELIIVDDGSTDGSSGIIDEYARRDPRIHVIRNPEATGRGAARNAGIELARADLMIVQDSDDTSVADRVEKQKAYMDSHPEVGLVASPHSYMTEDGSHLGTTRIAADGAELARRLRHYGAFCHCAAMYRTHAMREAGAYRNGFVQAQDYDMMLRVTEQTTVGVLNTPAYRVRQASSRMSLLNRGRKEAFGRLAKEFARQRDERGSDDYDAYMRDGKMPESVREGPASSPLLYYSGVIRQLLDCHEYAGALRLLRSGIREYPWRVITWSRALALITAHYVLNKLGLLDWVQSRLRRV
jgi:glycosyltransferase involved in cell wall biosynthesis